MYQLLGIRYLECWFSNISVNIVVAVFRINVFFGVLDVLYRSGSRWQVGCEGYGWRNKIQLFQKPLYRQEKSNSALLQIVIRVETCLNVLKHVSV
jgi:hypothetical protein